jgi:DNA topoisomerase-1
MAKHIHIYFHDTPEFKESEHPRASNGEFGVGGGSSGSKIVGAKEQKAKETFEKNIAGKSETDRKAFISAKSDGVSIPPAWSNVTYHGKNNDKGIIASGTDAKGRRQRLEDSAYREGKIAEKQQRITSNLMPKMGAIVGILKKQAEQNVESAKCLYLITQTGFRVGSTTDTGARQQAYGASTLLGKHVKVDGDTVHFDFIGKEGVRQEHSYVDPVIAKMVSGKKPEERIFNVSDNKLRDEWKKLGGEKVHDIRSVVATQTASSEIKKLVPPIPSTEKELNMIKLKVATAVARKLGNKPAESLRTYINPIVFAGLQQHV